MGNDKNKGQIAHMDTPTGIFQGRPETPPFLTTIRIFGKNLHNCLLDLGASTNVMPLAICKALDITPHAFKEEVDPTR